jgi:cell division protein FtsL
LRSRRKKKESKNRLALIIGLAFLLAVLWVWKSIQAHDMARELTSLENEKRRITESNKQLKAELEKLHSIAWIDSCARQYGMTYEVKKRLVLFDQPMEKQRQDRSVLVSVADYIVNLGRRLIK